MRRIVAIGGGGFLMEEGTSAIDQFLLRLTGQIRPRICFVPTASGDSDEHLAKFYAAFHEKHCVPSHLAFFRKPRANGLPVAHYRDSLLGQDVIFVGGGNTKSALAVWREWGLDEILKEAWQAGVTLSGMSAGALCWFEIGVSDSFGDGSYRPIPCLGFLRGGCAAHYDEFPQRREMLHAAIRSGVVPDTIAIDNGAAVVFTDHTPPRVVTWIEGAAAYQVRRSSDSVVEERYECERIAVVAT
jgi:peptidase E